MSHKSSKSLPRKKPKEPRDLSVDHDPKLMMRARTIANQYMIVIQPHKDGGFSGSCIEFPTIWMFADTPAKCFKKMVEALAIGVYVMLEAKQSPPVPAADERRGVQVNIRLTPREKLLLEATARHRGFKGLADYIRTTVLLDQDRRSA